MRRPTSTVSQLPYNELQANKSSYLLLHSHLELIHHLLLLQIRLSREAYWMNPTSSNVAYFHATLGGWFYATPDIFSRRKSTSLIPVLFLLLTLTFL